MMVFPNYKNKHLEEALWHPSDLRKKYPKLSNNFPKKFILVYETKFVKYFKKKFKPKLIYKHELRTIYQYKDIGFVYMDAIGSPHAVSNFESLIASGGKYFLSIGSAGGLQSEGIFLCTKALRDEGTSYHYIPHGEYIFPDRNLTDTLGNYFKKHKIIYKTGTTWTIDAPFRETIKEIEHYRKIGIQTVEMEASALFAVAKYRKVKIASAFVVSDTLIKKRELLIDKSIYKNNFKRLVDLTVDCLLNIKK
jgi:uridine phosphorylase